MQAFLIMNNNIEREAHKQWFHSAFVESEIVYLKDNGITCQADHKFFKNEIVLISTYISDYRFKLENGLYEKFVDRFIELIPKYLHYQIDRELMIDDIYYRAWFYNRKLFMDMIDRARIEASKATPWSRDYVLWSPIIDINSLDECIKMNNKLFHVMDENFLRKSVEHWAEVRRGCRCALIALNRAEVDKRQQMG